MASCQNNLHNIEYAELEKNILRIQNFFLLSLLAFLFCFQILKKKILFSLEFVCTAKMRWVALLLALCVSGALGAATKKLLGSEKCTWGPSYWCSGLAQSAGCRVRILIVTLSSGIPRGGAIKNITPNANFLCLIHLTSSQGLHTQL